MRRLRRPAAFRHTCSASRATPRLPERVPPSVRRIQYVGAGDVVRIDPVRRSLTSLYLAGSAFNTFLVTERCDNYCNTMVSS